MESDEALYARSVGGDLAAFDVLYARHERRLYGFLRAQLGDPAEAQDVLQETFLALLRARRAGTALRSFRAWLYQAARHLVLNRARSRQRADRAFALAALEPARAAEEPHDAAALGRAVATLSKPLAEVYHLRASGLSYDELAATLEVPVGTVKSRLHELVRRLRAALQEIEP
jgi:RNA polymerase sigma-70 factor, ECF subfamily